MWLIHFFKGYYYITVPAAAAVVVTAVVVCRGSPHSLAYLVYNRVRRMSPLRRRLLFLPFSLN